MLGRDEALAEHMAYGAVHWCGETDKERVKRAALDTYLHQQPKLGAALLFTASDKPLGKPTA